MGERQEQARRFTAIHEESKRKHALNELGRHHARQVCRIAALAEKLDELSQERLQLIRENKQLRELATDHPDALKAAFLEGRDRGFQAYGTQVRAETDWDRSHTKELLEEAYDLAPGWDA